MARKVPKATAAPAAPAALKETRAPEGLVGAAACVVLKALARVAAAVGPKRLEQKREWRLEQREWRLEQREWRLEQPFQA